MTGRDQIFAVTGVIFGVVVTCGALRFSNALAGATQRGIALAASATAIDGADDDADAGVDPAMAANVNLTQSLHECSQQLVRLMDDRNDLEQQLDGERQSEAAASRAAQARRMARRDISPDDWKQLASAGTVRYVLPCASFNPTPEVLDRLGLAPHDVPAIQSAFTGARDTAWAQLRPLCAAAVGSVAADRLGLDSCPQVILDAERATNPAAAAAAMRAVGSVKAGLADPSVIPPGDPVGAAFLLVTEVSKNAERQLGSVLSPGDARSIVYGNNGCSRASEFTSAAPVAAGDR